MEFWIHHAPHFLQASLAGNLLQEYPLVTDMSSHTVRTCRFLIGRHPHNKLTKEKPQFVKPEKKNKCHNSQQLGAWWKSRRTRKANKFRTRN
jgi:hypothetical protein